MARRRWSITSSVRAAEISAVSTGWRPGGFSSSTERSMSPYCASVRLRGIGVAVITSRSAALALCAEVHALAHPEAVLLVDDGEAEVAEGDVLLEERVGADEDVDLAGRQRGEPGGALGALVAAGQDVEPHPGGLGERLQRQEVLAGEDLGRGHQRRLAAGLDGGEHGEERDQGLAGADVALQAAGSSGWASPCRR